MSAPSEAEVQTQWKNTIALIMKIWKAGRTDADSIITRFDTLMQSIESDFGSNIMASGQQVRNATASIIGFAGTLQIPLIQSYLRHVYDYYNLTDINRMLDELYDQFAAGSVRIASRQFVFGSPTAGGSNVGTGQILRLNKDKNNFDIENQHADGKTALCIGDVSSGIPKWEEVFEFRGQSSGIDDLDGIGSGLSKNITALSARNSLLLNPSFSSLSGTITVPTAITDWTSSVTVNGTNYEFDEVNYYRDFEGDTTPRALQIKVTASLTQKLSLRGTVVDWTKPYLCQIAYKPNGAAGTLQLSLGSQDVSVVLSGGESNVWTILRVPLNTNLWPKNWTQADTEIVVSWTKTSGTIIIDEVLLTPMDEFDGSFYAIVPPNSGAPVQFLEDDVFTWTDTETGSVIQYWLFRAFNKYLPHATGGSITFTDPT